VTLVLRTDAGRLAGPGSKTRASPDLRIEVRRDGVPIATHWLHLPPRSSTQWNEPRVELADLAGGDELVLRALDRPWRSFHIWLLRP
jgi:hypothetical protein